MKNAAPAQPAASCNLQVLAKVKEVREATDAWAETSAASMASLLSKVGATVEAVANGVAVRSVRLWPEECKNRKQLRRNRRLAAGLVGNLRALEALRPQDIQAMGDLGESLEETLAPVFKSELRSHFEQELGPLIGLRVTEMLSAFREKMTECLQGIAAEHEQAAMRLGRDLAPVVAEELKQAQLEDLSRAVEIEAGRPGMDVIQPLHARVKELTGQALRGEVEQLQREGKQSSSPEAEASQATESARELQKLFQDGSVKMKLMYALAQQLSEKTLDEGIFHSKALQLDLDCCGSPLEALSYPFPERAECCMQSCEMLMYTD
eukprot:Skav235583  [mRNA]  locus=scaffold612:204153:214945:- [translate_table: standard]